MVVSLGGMNGIHVPVRSVGQGLAVRKDSARRLRVQG
jgi:hypothetical protein